jgi:pimeloyl-ACP methyl ester carboxylesterase
MARATATPRADRTIRLRDGRGLAYSEWGDLAGRPVVLLHGTPGSRLICLDEDATEAAGVRLLTVDRPGYGLSDPHAGRTVLDWVDDFVELAQRLELPPCPVIGWSSGGPYALALGFRLPDGITGIGLAAAKGPVDPVPGMLEASLPEGARAAFRLLRRDYAAGVAAIEEGDAWFSGDGWERIFARTWGDADDRVLADPATLEAMKTLMREAARQGPAGYVADHIAESPPWSFSVSEITQPVHIWYGESDDPWVPMSADYLVANIPDVTLVTYPGEAHLFPFDHWAEMLAAMV